jgi:hypothetical protein
MAKDNTVDILGRNSEAPARPGPSGLAAYKPLEAGLLYGGAASAVLGPVGLLVGLGAGILSKRLRKNFMDRETSDLENLRVEHQTIQDEIGAEMKIADPDEKRILSHAQALATNGWYKLASGDEQGRAMIDRANELSLSVMTSDRDARKQEQAAQAGVQRGLITTAANDYRTQYQQTMQLSDQVNTQASRILDLTAQKDFDPNKPINKAVLAELLSTGVGGFYKDSPDVLDAVSNGAGAIGSILGAARGGAGGAAVGGEVGNIVAAITNGMKAKDFALTREDYNRIAFNMRKVTSQYGGARMQTLSQQAESLNGFARQTGAIPQDYHLGEYISGGVKDLKLIPVPQMPGPAQANDASKRLEGIAPPSEEYVGPINERLRAVEQWMNKRKQRPTN